MTEHVGSSVREIRHRPSWRLIYFTLAAFNLIVVVLCLGLNHHLANLYRDSVEMNSHWSVRLDLVSELEALISDANIDLNDMLANQLPDKQAVLFDAKVSRFHAIAHELHTILNEATDHDPKQTASVIELLSKSHDGISTMRSAADGLFRMVREGDTQMAGPVMAEFERHYAVTIRSLASVRERISSIKDGHLNKQNDTASFIRNLEIVVGLLIVLLVIAIAYYGYRLSVTMRRMDDDQELVLLELNNQKSALDLHSIVSISDINGNITYANDKLCELSGYTHEELIGSNHRLLKSDEHSRAFFQDLWDTVLAGNIWRGEIKNRAKDGRYFWVDATIIPVKDEYGRITQHTAIRTNITALKEAEERNRHQAARLETATQGAQVGIWEYEIDTNRVRWNSTMHDLYGIRPGPCDDDNRFMLWHNAVHPDDIEEAERKLTRAIETDYPFDTMFRIIRADNGQTRYIKANATIERNAQGRAVNMIGVNWDVTDSMTASREIERREEEIRAILDAIPAFVYYKDANNTILRLNRAAANSIGKPMSEIENHKTEEFFPAEDAAHYLRDDREVIFNRQPKLGLVESHNTNGKNPLNIRTDKIPLRNSEGVYDRLVTIATDITDQTDNEKRLRESEERYTLAVRGSRDGLWDWDLITDRVYYAPRWRQMLGLKDESVSDSPDEWISRIDQRDLCAFMREFDQHLRGEDQVFEVELRMRHYDGHTIWMLCRGAVVRDKQGQAIRVAGSLADINEIKQVQDELRRMAEHDRLTSLPNRELFHSRLCDAIERSRTNPGYKFAILFFDFDRFKVINDSLGHNVGDALLSNIADQFRHILRTNDTAARFGGDEFVVLLNDLKTYEEALQAGKRLLDTFAKPHRIMGHDVFSTASIGLVTNESGYDNPEDMLRDADAAMYQAKEAGRARIIVFDQMMHHKALDRLQLEIDLREALKNDEFHLVYQPIISLEAGELYGFEALLRWDHPKRGIVSPTDFIPIAEDTGLIVPIGEWVLRHACRQLYQWNNLVRPELPITLNVNLSMRQVCHPNIMDMIRAAVDDTGIDTQYLKLEVTESTIVDDRNNMIPRLNQIKDMGISLAMDDFGTGHSSLGNLHKLPIDVLKIDQSFIKSMSANRELAAVMHAIITLAHELGMQTVAEGIETPEQLVMLQSLNCNFGQGYYFKRPMLRDAATRYLLGMEDSAASA